MLRDMRVFGTCGKKYRRVLNSIEQVDPIANFYQIINAWRERIVKVHGNLAGK